MRLMLTRCTAPVGRNSFAIPWMARIFSPGARGPFRAALNFGENRVSRNRMSGANFALIILDLFRVGGAIPANHLRIGGQFFRVALLLDFAFAFSFAALLVVSFHAAA